MDKKDLYLDIGQVEVLIYKVIIPIVILSVMSIPVYSYNANEPYEFKAIMKEQESISQQILDKQINEPVVVENKYLFIGDSRFVGMEQSIRTDKDIVWIDKVGARHDYYWDNHDIIASIDKDRVVVYELGVNDLASNACINVLNDLQRLGFKSIYFVTVTPVNEEIASSYGYMINNEQINQFNQQVKNNVPSNIKVIDTYDYLRYNGIETDDGLHYKNVTYQMWFNFIVENAK